MKKIKKRNRSHASKTNSGILSVFEKIIRSHALLYFFIRKIIRYTNIFEEDANGVKILNLSKKVNIFDIGASDGIATKFFLNNLNVNKIYCFEPQKKIFKISKITFTFMNIKYFFLYEIKSKSGTYNSTLCT